MKSLDSLPQRTLIFECDIISLSVTDEKAKSQHPTQCTKCDPQKRFFSYRRDGPQFGTQVGFIRLRDTEHDANCQIL